MHISNSPYVSMVVILETHKAEPCRVDMSTVWCLFRSQDNRWLLLSYWAQYWLDALHEMRLQLPEDLLSIWRLKRLVSGLVESYQVSVGNLFPRTWCLYCVTTPASQGISCLSCAPEMEKYLTMFSLSIFWSQLFTFFSVVSSNPEWGGIIQEKGHVNVAPRHTLLELKSQE